jgi:hypothetical protein
MCLSLLPKNVIPSMRAAFLIAVEIHREIRDHAVAYRERKAPFLKDMQIIYSLLFLYIAANVF